LPSLVIPHHSSVAVSALGSSRKLLQGQIIAGAGLAARKKKLKFGEILWGSVGANQRR
jgi:hypothetical protein